MVVEKKLNVKEEKRTQEMIAYENKRHFRTLTKKQKEKVLRKLPWWLL